MSDILSINNLAVSFKLDSGELHALRGIDLSLAKGEVLAVVGESGSGKSITAKAILGLLPRGGEVSSGSIRYKGRNLLSLSEAEMSLIRGREISLVPQDPFLSLDPISRVGEQIAESVIIDEGVPRRERKQIKRRIAVDLMREVGIRGAEERYYEYPFRLSGGMRQRVAIAAALAPSPEVLICDEPTTALDVTIEAQILDLFIRLKDERKLSMIFITHDLGVVARVADRVAVMYAGKIVEVGLVEEIFYNPKHPYTWALMGSLPENGEGRLKTIPGCVPDMRNPPKGDAFAPRNEYAMRIDEYIEPPFFTVSKTHKVASWLYHEQAPIIEPPEHIRRMIERRRSGE